MIDQIADSQVSTQIVSESVKTVPLAKDSNQANLAPQAKAVAYSAVEPVSYQDALKEIDNAIAKLNEALASKDHSIRFRRDETLNRSVITVVNDDTGEVVRQLPSEEMLQVARNLESLKGIIIKEWV